MQYLKAGVVGASGYAGGELLRLLANHPQLAVTVVTGSGSAGRDLIELHPNLAGDPRYAQMVLQPATVDGLSGCDVVFLALPHGHSAALAVDLPADVVVVDLGADHRLADPEAWQRYYGLPHAGHWAYGLPELAEVRPALRGARRIANPGCYPTAVALALAPLLGAGLVRVEDIVVVAASGTSGAGRGLADTLHSAAVMGSMSAYKVGGGHQHTPEMEQSLSAAAGSPVTLSFTPMLAPMARGILATVSAAALTSAVEDVREALYTAYVDEPFVTVLPEGRWPTTGAVLGSNSAQLQVALDPHSGRVSVVSAIDNLVKGAAGQAIQNANIALDLEETTGLPLLGVAP